MNDWREEVRGAILAMPTIAVSEHTRTGVYTRRVSKAERVVRVLEAGKLVMYFSRIPEGWRHQ